ncbi:ankyrin repeat-containing domain protein [Aspergillus ambiguus]|uniref:ankyrin repeat-containing domain protein n=1 Tax=Aspergillus ambiguus TaxID=176160 RepID=UPI003CCDC941
MRLINTTQFFTGRLETVSFDDDSIPPYAILSHTWDEEELSFQDMGVIGVETKRGYEKIKQCCSLAQSYGFEYVWIDTCCIDKTSSAELSEAINSMYRWYQEADVCFAHLADVPSKKKFSESRWFTRGWTLQELIAPSKVLFLDETWVGIGDKTSLQQSISDCTTIPAGILSGEDELEMFSIAQRMSWAARRQTKRTEDRAYSLMGIFDVNMPLIYGEGETAFIRLQEEIMRISDDQSLFSWKSWDNRGGLLATSPAAFKGCGDIVQTSPFDTSSIPSTSTSRGIHLELPLLGVGRGLGLAILCCQERAGNDSLIAIFVKDLTMAMIRFERVRTDDVQQVDLSQLHQPLSPMRRIFIRGGRLSRIGRMGGSEELGIPGLNETFCVGDLIKSRGVESPLELLHAVENGLDDIVHVRSDLGSKALMIAIEKGHEGIVRLLLARGANATVGESKNLTPLLKAVEYGHEAIVKLLLDRGASTEAKNLHEETAIARLLLQKRAVIEAKGQMDHIVKLLLEKGAYTGARDVLWRTPLSYAARIGSTGIVALLLPKGPEHINTKDIYGRTPLSYAAENGYEDIVQILYGKGALYGVKDSSELKALYDKKA